MNLKNQIIGINQFLKKVYNAETRLSTLLLNVGIEKSQIELLRNHHLESIVESFIEIISERLKDERLVQIITYRFGLDGHSPCTLRDIGNRLGISRERVRQLEYKAIKRCKSRRSLHDLSEQLHKIALAHLRSIAGSPTLECVIDKLDKLAEIRAAADITRSKYERKRYEILEKVKAELEALDTEYAELIKIPDKYISDLEAEIKTDVLLHGTTVRGTKFKAVYVSGRITWDSKGLEEYAEIHPEVSKFKKQGEPSISIRAVRQPGNSHKDILTTEKTETNIEEQEKTFRVEQVRQKFPRAYKPWSIEDDEQLKKQHAIGLSFSNLADYFGRNEGAIRARLKKLGVLS